MNSNQRFGGLRRDLDFPSEDLIKLKKKLEAPKLPAIPYRNEINQKYEKIIQTFSEVIKDMSHTTESLSTDKQIEQYLDKMIRELKECRSLSEELDKYVTGEVIKKSAETESKYCEMIKEIDDEIKNKQALSSRYAKENEGRMSKIKELEEKEKELRKGEFWAHQRGGHRGGFYMPGNGNQGVAEAYARDISENKADIDKWNRMIQDVENQIKSILLSKGDLEAMSKVGQKLLNDLTSLSNKLSQGTIFFDNLITFLANVQINFVNLNLSQVSIDTEVKFDINDPKSLRNETLNMKEFETRLNLLKKTYISNLSPKSQTEFNSLSEVWNNYTAGKLEGQTVEISRLTPGTAYYYVKLPQSNVREIKGKVEEYLQKSKIFSNSSQEHKNSFFSCFNEYSSYFDSQIRRISTEIEIRKKKNSLLDDIQSISGSGESQTEKIYNLSVTFMNLQGLKGVLMIAHKGRHYGDTSNCPIVETDTYVVYLGIQSGWIKMNSFYGGFLNMTKYYYRGFENWSFGGVGGYKTPSIEDNGIKV
jgi:hypothetical protein